MNLTSTERPRIPGTDTPALRLEGSAVPQITVMPVTEDTVRLSAWLRNFDSANTREYSERQAIVHIGELANFFADYFALPEATLAMFFRWKDQKAAWAASPVKPVAAAPTELSSVLDLF